MFHLHTTLRRLAEKRKNDEKGFTLVELMVVVLIIGILVAIAIPVFLNTRRGADDSSAKSDAKNVTTAIQAFQSNNNTLPTLQQLQGELGSKPVSATLGAGTSVAYASTTVSGTVVARQGTSGICFKATVTSSGDVYKARGSGECNTTALTSQPAGTAAW